MTVAAADLHAEVVVVGAGLSGLVAAQRLARAGLDVHVMEARPRVGGRTVEVAVSDDQVVEMGGQFVGPGQHHMLGLLDQLGIGTYPTYDGGRHLFEHRGRTVRYAGRIPTLDPIGLLDAGQAALRLGRAARRVPLDRPWAAARAAQWDSETTATLIRRTTATRLGRLSLRLFVQAVFSCEPEDLSALHFLFYVHACGGFSALTRTTGGAQQWRVEGGAQVVARRLAAELGDRVHLAVPVCRMDWGDDGVTAFGDELVVRARRAVVALPPALAGRLDYRPGLPVERDQLQQRSPQGSVIKCMAVYAEPWWRRRGLSGQSASDAGPVCATYDNTPPSGAPGVLLAFVEGAQSQRLRRLDPAARRGAVLGCLQRLFGPEAGEVTGWHELDWSAEQWTRGCYGAHLPPGVWTKYGPVVRQPVGAIHWAGSETAQHWPSYMDGAVESGQRVAREVLALAVGRRTHKSPLRPLVRGAGRAYQLGEEVVGSTGRDGHFVRGGSADDPSCDGTFTASVTSDLGPPAPRARRAAPS